MDSYFYSVNLFAIVPLEEIAYVDYPEILINEHERTEMPFRYVKDASGEPIMPDVSKIPKVESILANTDSGDGGSD